MNEPLGATALIGRSLRLFFGNLGFLFPLAFVPSLALTALAYLLGDPLGNPEASLEFGPAEALSVFLNIMAGFVLTGVMCLAGLDVSLGKRHTVGEYVRQTMRHIWPIVALGVLLSAATGLGVVLLIVPGLYITARYLPWAPAIVFENAGWSGLGRAQELTEGRRWPLVGLILVMAVMVLAALLAAGLLLGTVAAQGSLILAVLIEAALAGLYYALIAVFVAQVYLRLRELREGAGLTEIAESIG